MFRFLLLLMLLSAGAHAQVKKTFTKYEYRHGKLTPLRTCIDVKQYEITLKVDPAKKHISGLNEMTFFSITAFSKLQIDLFPQMKIDSIIYQGRVLAFSRDSNTAIVDFVQKVPKKKLDKLSIYFSGNPLVAKKAPWDGGFVWTKDEQGNDWVGLACEGIGASVWLPCKDHWSDEPDSMKMHLVVPNGLTGVSNGRLTGEHDLHNGFKQFDWEVKSPINIYNISVNVARYVHFHDAYKARFNDISQPLDLDYYVLAYNKEKAEKHFMQVQRMMECFEKSFGPYPFWEDGYKLVETPYWGMEHQSCVAYGNGYEDNRYGFDFIIIHESAHEWFGNSITANDPADMWIHESFTTYAEAVFVEYFYGKQYAIRYLKDQRKNIVNKEPMIGPVDVYYHGHTDNDIYYKGAWILHTLRNATDNDTLWFNTLRNFATSFKKQNINTQQVISFFSTALKRDLQPVFTQYLYHTNIPVLEYKVKRKDDDKMEIRYRWANVVKDFDLPVKMTMVKDKFEIVTPMRSWQLVDPNYLDEAEFKVQQDNLIEIKKLK